MSRSRRYDVAFYVPWMTALLSDGALGPTGGAETQILLLSRALARRGLSVCVIVFDARHGDIPASVNGVDVLVRPPYLVGRTRFGRLREIAAMRTAILGVDADVVVTRTASYHVGLIGIWTKLAGRRFVYSSASLRDLKYESFLDKWSDRIGFRVGLALADTMIVQTQEQVELCEQRFRRKPTLIRSVSEPAEQSDREPEAFLWVGRVDVNKRPLEFVQLAHSLPEARFRMVAIRLPGSRNERLWHELEQATVGLPNLELWRPRPWAELLDLIGRSVAVVSTSKFEGMPNVFLEGWARGIPALALEHDPDGVIDRHRLGGFAHGRRDTLVELASDLWRDRTLRSQCAARCREYTASNHAPEAVSARWVQALQIGDDAIQRPFAVEAG
jgi:glycosyltransferase involved in cell wall biosynthesis